MRDTLSPPMAHYQRRRMLYGRSEESAVTGDMLDGVRHGRSSVLVVRGEAGAGTSTQLDFATRSAGGLRILRVVGLESEVESGPRGHVGQHDVVDDVFDELAGDRVAGDEEAMPEHGLTEFAGDLHVHVRAHLPTGDASRERL